MCQFCCRCEFLCRLQEVLPCLLCCGTLRISHHSLTPHSFSLRQPTAATSLRPPEARKITYVQNKPSIPLSITVPHYSASEFLAAASYLTCQGHLTSKLELRDLLCKFRCRWLCLLLRRTAV